MIARFKFALRFAPTLLLMSTALRNHRPQAIQIAMEENPGTVGLHELVSNDEIPA